MPTEEEILMSTADESPNASPATAPSTAEAARNALATHLPFDLKNLSQAITVGGVAVYICGFVVVTAHLGQFGLNDYAAFRMQYLVAGAVYCLVIGLFAYFVGRSLVGSTKLQRNIRKHLEDETGQTGRWANLAGIYALFDILNGLFTCAALCSVLLFPLRDVATGIALAVYFMISFFTGFYWTSRMAEHASKKAFVITCVLRAIAIAGYGIAVKGVYWEMVEYYWWCLAALSFYLMAIEGIRDKGAVTAYFFVVIGVVVQAGIFGSHFYSRVRPGVGGAAPVTAQLIVDEDDAPQELQSALRHKDGSLVDVDVIAETEAELVLGLSQKDGRYGQLLRVKRDLVKTILLKDTRTWVPTP